MKYIESIREGERVSGIYLCKQRQSAVTKNGKAYENKKCFYADFNSVYLGHGICGSEYGNGLSGTDNI